MRFFHGGVPGLQPGDDVLSATRLNRRYAYHHPSAAARYDPNYVYFTTHLGTARAYAARYLDRSGRPRPGDVYEVEPARATTEDPDYPVAGPDRFLMAARARVTAVVDTAVAMDAREQNKASWPYTFWESVDEIRYDSDGTVLPSKAMSEFGVSRDYLRLLPKWMEPDRIFVNGAIAAADRSVENASMVELVDVFGHLNLDSSTEHQVMDEVSELGVLRLTCRCGRKVSCVLDGFVHQVGEPELKLIIRYNITPDDVWPFITEFARRAPERWMWLRPVLLAVGRPLPVEALYARPEEFRRTSTSA